MKFLSSKIFILPAIIFLLSADTTENNPFPTLVRYKLKNGLEVIFADYGKLPVTSLSFFVNVGKKSETPGQQGLAELTANSLDLGSERYSRIEEGRFLYRTDGTLSISANENFTLAQAEFLNKDIEKGMDLISSVLLKPLFPEADINEQKGFELSQNKPSKMDIGNLADMYGNYFTYGIANPLGRHYYQAQYSKLTTAQIKEFYNFNYTPGNVKLLVTGNPDHDQMKKLIEQYFGNWTAAYGEVNGSSYDIPPIKKHEYAFIEKDSAKQACLEWFKKAPAAGSKDVAAFNLANAVFSDHLGKEIREKDGYTYGIYSRYSESQNDEIFRTKTQVRNDVMFATMTAFDKVLNDFYNNGATENELKKFKTMLKTDIESIEEPTSFATLINPWVYRDYSKRQNYLAELDAIDLPTLMKTIKKYFTPDAYKVIIVGDATSLGDQLGKISGLQKLDINVIEKDQ